MADDLVTIDPEYRSDSRGGDGGRDSTPAGITLLAVALATTLIFSWLVIGQRRTDPESNVESLPVTTIPAIVTAAEPTTTAIPTETTEADRTWFEPVLRATAFATPFLADLRTPNDLAIDPAGALFVSDSAAAQIIRVEILAGGSAGRSVVVARGIEDAGGIALDDQGRIYVAGSNAVQRIADGVATVLASGFADPDGLALDVNGDLFVADGGPPEIRISRFRFRDDGSVDALTEIARVPGSGAADIDFGPAGDLFIADNLDGVWRIDSPVDGGAAPIKVASLPIPPEALAFDTAGTLYIGGTGDIWSLGPGGRLRQAAYDLNGIGGLAIDVFGGLYFSNAGTNEVLRSGYAIDASGAGPNSSTTPPDVAGALPGDDGTGPLPLDTVVDGLPPWPYLDFLYELCDSDCYRDAVLIDQGGNYDPWPAGAPFYVRQGFMNGSVEPLGRGFEVVLYLTRWSGPETPEDEFELGQTYRFTSDYVVRGITDRCGPTYRTQSAPMTCEWFVHEFPGGIPEGRYDLWAVWEAPCSGWAELGFTDVCTDPDAVVSMFTSGVNSPIDG